MPKKVYIIAEAGVNHNGNFTQAVKLVEAALAANADAIKFQTFVSEECISTSAKLAPYQEKNINNNFDDQLQMVKKLELPFEDFVELYKLCQNLGIDFLSTPFDNSSINFLSKLNMPVWKIPSGEITNLPYLRKIGSLAKKILLSTGMTDLGEIEDALDLLRTAGIQLNNITVLHCNTEYPTPMKDVNLRAMLTIQAAFPGVKIGYSDHTEGIEVPIAAVALGATVIEKHFTLKKTLPGPDHKSSLEPDEFAEMVSAIRNIEKAMGGGEKKPSPSERKNIVFSRKSIVAAKYIEKGDIFSEHNLTIKRPGFGLSPMLWDEIMGSKAKRAYNTDELIET
jgi:N,N'-diacetyllegionaminate synthase